MDRELACGLQLRKLQLISVVAKQVQPCNFAPGILASRIQMGIMRMGIALGTVHGVVFCITGMHNSKEVNGGAYQVWQQ